MYGSDCTVHGRCAGKIMARDYNRFVSEDNSKWVLNREAWVFFDWFDTVIGNSTCGCEWTTFDSQWSWMNWDKIQAFAWWVGLKEVTNCLVRDNPRPSRTPPENNQPTQHTTQHNTHTHTHTLFCGAHYGFSLVSIPQANKHPTNWQSSWFEFSRSEVRT
jgi:hypothetical protein